MWYLDDATIGGPASSVFADLQRIIPALSFIGREINPAKSELINVTCDQGSFTSSKDSINHLLNGVKITCLSDLEILGAAVSPEATEHSLTRNPHQLQVMIRRLQFIDSHPAFFLLSRCLALPRLICILSASPCFEHPEHLNNFDKHVEQTIRQICNLDTNTFNWSQLTLPLRYGGLGVGSKDRLALTAFLSSICAGRSLIQEILSKFPEFNLDVCISNTMERWPSKDQRIPEIPERQKSWSSILCDLSHNSLLAVADQRQLTCIKSASQPHSGDWLNALPNSPTGGLLANSYLRIAMGLRLGLKLCHPLRCRCGHMVDEMGLHPLSCRSNSSSFPRHSAINDIIKLAMERASFPCSLEPVGLDRGDGKRPDVITLFPFEQGKSLLWDATCVDTFSQSNIISSAMNPGSAAKLAERR